MKIMKIVYLDKQYDHREEEWSVGEGFKGAYRRGTITSIAYRPETGATIYVDGAPAIYYPTHLIQRVYYGE